MNENEIQSFDILTDEYSNYYQTAVITSRGGKLTEVQISNIYFETAFERVFLNEDIEKYKFQHIGAYLQDIVKSKIEGMLKSGRRIYSIKELQDNGVAVTFSDSLAQHPRASTN